MKHSRRTMWIVVAVLIVASLALAAFITQPSAETLLTQALETMEGVNQGYAQIELVADLPEERLTGKFKLWGQLDAGPNGEPAFRFELIESSQVDAAGLTIVGDGNQVWIWHPGHNAVYTGTSAELAQYMRDHMAGHEFDHTYEGDHADMDVPETAEEAVARLLEYFQAERNGTTEKMGTQPAYKVRLIPIPEKMPDEVRAAGGFLNVWIGADSQAPLGVEYAEGAVGYAKISVTELTLNSELEADTFVLDIPPGADVIPLVEIAEAAMAAQATAAEFETLSPTQLPEGAILLETSQVGGAMVQRYSLPEGASFTVAQGPAELSYQPDSVGTAVTVRGESGLIYTDEEGARSLLSWTEGQLSFWIGGDLSQAEALAIAESLQ